MDNALEGEYRRGGSKILTQLNNDRTIIPSVQKFI